MHSQVLHDDSLFSPSKMINIEKPNFLAGESSIITAADQSRMHNNSEAGPRITVFDELCKHNY